MQVFSLHYLPCIEWFSFWLKSENAVIDVHEHFVKQTYRNRTRILSANGPLDLSIPVKKQAHHTPMNQMRIENDFTWQHQHWQTIVSAYQSSPYFEHYQPYFEVLYQKEFNLLKDWNEVLLLQCLKLMKVEKKIEFSSSYIEDSGQIVDYRKSISPKVASAFLHQPYLQVFTEKFSFQPNLSILDLLFNKGPRWKDTLGL